MANSTLTCCQRIHWRFRSIKAAPALRMRSADSSTLPALTRLSVVASPADSVWRSGDVWRDGGRWQFVPNFDGLTGSEWCADQRRPRADEWRSNDARCGDGWDD